MLVVGKPLRTVVTYFHGFAKNHWGVISWSKRLHKEAMKADARSQDSIWHWHVGGKKMCFLNQDCSKTSDEKSKATTELTSISLCSQAKHHFFNSRIFCANQKLSSCSTPKKKISLNSPSLREVLSPQTNLLI